jgi:hypothetical protein
MSAAFLFQRLSGALLMALIMAFLAGCAGSRGVSDGAGACDASAGCVQEASLDSLRAKFLLNITQENGDVQEFDVVLFSVPGKRYRLELTGPLGIGVASMLWTESGWQMVFPTEKLYVKGNGYMVGLLNDNTLPLVHIHQVAALFEGKLLPERFEKESTADSAGVTVVKAKEPTGRLFTYGEKDGRVQWLSRQGRDGKPEKIVFSDVGTLEGREMPKNIRFERDGKPFLEIRIKKVTRGKAFSLGTWRLNIPKSYKAVGE